MSIHWYPGHMHKARKQIEENLPKVDLVIEVLDARIPFSSENPVIRELLSQDGYTRPCIKVLTKSDLADPEITQSWCDHIDKAHNLNALSLTTEQPGQAQQLINLCRQLFPNKGKSGRPIHAMIMGIPNVGKSTLINTLAGKSIARVGNEPAITKAQQRIDLDNGIILSDTPGILWPKIENQNSSYRLAVLGSIKDTAIEYEDIAFFAADYLLQAYPQNLQERYQLTDLPDTALALLEEIGCKRGCLRAGGQVDLNKVSTLFINELRTGQLGRISLETPQMIEKELKETELKLARKQEKKAKRKKKTRHKKNR